MSGRAARFDDLRRPPGAEGQIDCVRAVSAVRSWDVDTDSDHSVAEFHAGEAGVVSRAIGLAATLGDHLT